MRFFKARKSTLDWRFRRAGRSFLTLLILALIGVTTVNQIDCAVPSKDDGTLFSNRRGPLLKQSCFTADDLTVLEARRHYEQMLPETLREFVPLDDDTNAQQIRFIVHLEKTTAEATEDKESRELLLIAFADAVGAFMLGYFIPVIKYSFYGGFVSHLAVNDATRLAKKYETFIRSNRVGSIVYNDVKLYDLDPTYFLQQVEPIRDEEIENVQPNCHRMLEGPLGTLKPIVELDDESAEIVQISLPYHRNGSVHNPRAKSANRVLLQYYIETSKCLRSKKDKLSTFQRELSEWISNHIGYILTNDTALYPAFESILRVQKTIDNGRKLPKKSITEINEYIQEDEDNDDFSANSDVLEQSSNVSTVKKLSIWVGCSLAALLIVYIVFKMKQNRTIIASNRLTHHRRKHLEKRRSSSRHRISRDVSEGDEVTVFDLNDPKAPNNQRTSGMNSKQRKFSVARLIQCMHPNRWKSNTKGYESVAVDPFDAEVHDPLLLKQHDKWTEDDPRPGPSGINKKIRSRSCSCISCIEQESCVDAPSSVARSVTYSITSPKPNPRNTSSS